MDNKYNVGETVYLIDNGNSVEEAVVVMHISGFTTVRFTEQEGGTRVRESHLFRTSHTRRSRRKHENKNLS